MKFIIERRREPLAELADYLDEAKNKSLAERKELWWALVAREGVDKAIEIGDGLAVEETVVSGWIRDWIKSRQRPAPADIPLNHALNSMAVHELDSGDLSGG